MVIFRNRFPSKRDIVLVFACCVVPVYSWSMLAFFRKLSSWLLFLSLEDLIGIFAYAQTFAFLESVMILLVLILLSVILPARFLRRRFVAQGSVMVLLTAVCVIVVQYKPWIILSPKALLFGLALYFVSNGVAYVLIHRYKRVEESIRAFVERLTVLLYVYLTVTVFSIIIVVFRNI